MHTEIIEILKGSGWQVTLHDIGRDQAHLVVAVQLRTPTEMWWLAQECLKNGFDMGSVFCAGEKIVYFPKLIADADDFARIVK